ncbi:hypothetical protein OZX73_00800 [Bifidobacterium sp. ESL0775]|uniref:RNase H family protein n=1 Tax=Bifidobacterium sp. ESL0775 TaxID=2983230 RepID=UPI0023F74921|nr:RNase H family protein [Bifidobacterium sp. ESL0775]WEV69470.1 hypothetical protein OZX73_00800 [Bifidobacterium sp. ESL0775]
MIICYTDGSALNPHGPIGWAWHDEDGNEKSGGSKSGTNNIGELTAIESAIESHPGDEPLTIFSDSEYSVNAIKKAPQWRADRWTKPKSRGTGRDEVKNPALLDAILDAIERRHGSVCVKWTESHVGTEGNERCDTLAKSYAFDVRRNAKPHCMTPAGDKAIAESTALKS